MVGKAGSPGERRRTEKLQLAEALKGRLRSQNRAPTLRELTWGKWLGQQGAGGLGAAEAEVGRQLRGRFSETRQEGECLSNLTREGQ